MPEKTCSECGEIKSLDEFFRSSKSKDGLRSQCKICCKVRKRNYREQARNYSKRYRRELRARVIELLGGACSGCRIDDVRLLHIDHVEGGGTKERRTIHSTGIYQKILKGNGGYQLLCANCNWLKRYTNAEAPYQTNGVVVP